MKINTVLQKTLLGIVIPVVLIGVPVTVSMGGPLTNIADAASQGCLGSIQAPAAGEPLGDQCDSTDLSAPCLASINSGNTANCTQQDLSIYDVIKGNVDRGGATATDIQLAKKVPTQVSCSSTIFFIGNFSTCLFRTFVVGIGSVLMSLTAWLLGVAGLLFNWIVSNTVVSFGSVYAQVQAGVVAAWTVFRDIANILIIGVFVFVAISYILGIEAYGQKKYVARILIIAVLINFSLLFTEMIIDFSNFTAGQFYSVIGTQIAGSGAATGARISFSQNGSGANSTDPNSQAASSGIAGTFIAMTGVNGFAGYYDSLSTIAKTNDSGWLALLHGLVVATLFLMAALVLFYGSYILIVRAILLIFILLTSSIAFATYIIPSQSFVKEGWTKWWGSLIKSAVLAPLLMIFLWATANIGATLSHGAGGVNLGTLAANPPSGTSIQLLFNYFIVLGLLFASFKVANSLSSSIAGFDWASMATGSLLGIAGAAAGIAGRNAIGWPSSAITRARRASDRITQIEEAGGLSASLSKRVTRLTSRLARTSFNPLKSGTGAQVAGVLGIPKQFIGKNAKLGEGGFEGVMGRKAKRVNDLAERIEPDATGLLGVRHRAEETARRRHEAEMSRLGEIVRTNTESKEALLSRERPGAEDRARQAQGAERTDAENALNEARTTLVAERQRSEAANEQHASNLRIAEARAANAQDDATRQNAQNEINNMLNQRRQASQEQEERIRNAQQLATQREQALTNLNEAARRAAETELNTRAEVQQLNRTIAEARAGISALGDVGKVAKQAGEKAVADFKQSFRESLLWDKRAIYKIAGEMSSHHKRENLRELARLVAAEEGAGGGAAKTAGGGEH